jgi:uncharacterized membrane protein YhaH (DUF805 family)
MSFVGAVKTSLKRWSDYRGVSDRREYWYFTLFSALVIVVVATIDGAVTGDGTSINLLNAQNVVQIALYIWILPLTVRRFHDAGFSGFWLLTSVIPFIFVALSGPAILLFSDTLNVYLTVTHPTDAQDLMLANRFAAAFGLTILTALPIGIFQFVLTLLKSKPSWRGNRYAPVTEAPKDGWA